MSKFKSFRLESVFCLVLGFLIFLFFTTETHAEETVIDCDGKVYKYKKSFWSDPAVSIRSSARWKPYCEEGSLQTHDKGAECKLGYEYFGPTYETRIQTSKNYKKLKNQFRKDSGACKSPECKYLNHLHQENLVPICETYQFTTGEINITTSQTYLIDFYLKEISRTIKDGSKGSWIKECELMPN